MIYTIAQVEANFEDPVDAAINGEEVLIDTGHQTLVQIVPLAPSGDLAEPHREGP